MRKIYEMKGLISSLAAMREYDENINPFMVDSLEGCINEITALIEGGGN